MRDPVLPVKEDVQKMAIAKFIYLLKNIGAEFFKCLLALPFWP